LGRTVWAGIGKEEDWEKEKRLGRTTGGTGGGQRKKLFTNKKEGKVVFSGGRPDNILVREAPTNFWTQTGLSKGERRVRHQKIFDQAGNKDVKTTPKKATASKELSAEEKKRKKKTGSTG